MKIGIIGAGAIGIAFASHAAKAGYEVLISNSRGAESLKNVATRLGSNVKAANVKEAAEADVLFLGLQWQHILEVVKEIDFKGKVVIDPTNPILPGFIIAPLQGKSSSELLQELIGEGQLVKAFNNLQPELLASEPRTDGGNRVIFYSGNFNESKETVAELISKMGFAGIDLGTLKVGGPLQQFPGSPFAGLNLIKRK